MRYRGSMNPVVCCLASSWTRPSPLALLHHPQPTSTQEPGLGSLPQEAPPQLETHLHTQGPETAEGQVTAKTQALTASMFTFGCILFFFFFNFKNNFIYFFVLGLWLQRAGATL